MKKTYTNYVGCGHSINIFNPETKNGIKVDGHRGTWGVIDSQYYDNINQKLYLCEHEQYGDETACIIIDENYNLIMDDVWNGFDDYEETIQWEQYKKNYMTVEVIKERKISDDTWIIRGKFEKMEYDVIIMVTNVLLMDKFSFFYESSAPKDKSTFENEIKKYFASKVLVNFN